MKRVLIGLLLLLPLFGCPDPASGPGEDGVAPPTSESSGEAPPTDPLEGSVFSQEELFEIYAAYQAEDEAKGREVLRQHRLIDAEGTEQPTRVKAFDAALKTYAERDPEAWAEFVETLGQ